MASVAGYGRSPAQNLEKPAADVASSNPLPISDEVAQAEAAIVKSDWTVAEAKLDTWPRPKQTSGNFLDLRTPTGKLGRDSAPRFFRLFAVQHSHQRHKDTGGAGRTMP